MDGCLYVPRERHRSRSQYHSRPLQVVLLDNDRWLWWSCCTMEGWIWIQYSWASTQWQSEIHRLCGFALPEGLLYPTDSPLDNNYIQLLRQEKTIEKILPIDGSCIYSCHWGKDFIFESTVEPDGIYKNLIDFLFRWKKDPGIKDSYSHLLCWQYCRRFQRVL